MTGGAGSDVFVIAADGDDAIYGGYGNDSLSGELGDDYVNGEDGNDTLSGGQGVDTIIGGDGDDLVEIGQSASAAFEIYEGGGGADTLLVTASDGAVAGSAVSGFETLQLGMNAGLHLTFEQLQDFSNVFDSAGNEQLQVIAQVGAVNDFSALPLIGFSDSGDTMTVLGSAGDEELIGSSFATEFVGGFGADTITGGSGNDTSSYADSDVGVRISFTGPGARGTAEGDILSGIDVLIGSDFRDKVTVDLSGKTVEAGAGDDVVKTTGAIGDTTVRAGEGDDFVLTDAGNDWITGDAGQDTIQTRDGDDTVAAGADDDVVRGGDGDDLIAGDEGNDRLYGDRDNDTIDGGIGNDDLYGGAGNDNLIGGLDNDELFGENGADVLDGGAGKDTLHGGSGNDQLSGGLQNDILNGDDGNDTLDATGSLAGEKDFLFGGDGNDLMFLDDGDVASGGAGADTFDFGPGSGRAKVSDFEVGVDTLNLQDYGAVWSDVTITQSGTSTSIQVSGYADEILLQNFTATTLNITDFDL